MLVDKGKSVENHCRWVRLKNYNVEDDLYTTECNTTFYGRQINTEFFYCPKCGRKIEKMAGVPKPCW